MMSCDGVQYALGICLEGQAKKPVNRDSSVSITLSEFDQQVNECIGWLKTKSLKDISDDRHIQIMVCLNTIFMWDLHGGIYDQLKEVSEKKNYVRDIINVYPEWVPNRGMGYYFTRLKMELYGTPMPYAVYNLVK